MPVLKLAQARINAAFASQVTHAALPQTVTVQDNITVTLDMHHITVSELNIADITIPAHVRDGRVWPGTWAQEDCNRARVRDLDEERERMIMSSTGLTPEADAALALAERTVSQNAILRYLSTD